MPQMRSKIGGKRMAIQDFIVFVENLIRDAERLLSEEPKRIEPVGNEDTIEYLRRAIKWAERCQTELLPMAKHVEDDTQASFIEQTYDRLHISGWSYNVPMRGNTAEKIRRSTSDDLRSSRSALQSLVSFLSGLHEPLQESGGIFIKPNPFLLSSQYHKTVPRKVFSIMSWQLKDTIYLHIKDILTNAGYELTFAGDRNGQVVFEDIWRLMTEAEVVVVDFTGRRPNVYLEFGMAIVLGKPIIALTQNKEDLPSDTPNLKCILYKDLLGDATLKNNLVKAIENTLQDFRSV
jgi:hypothetical protein